MKGQNINSAADIYELGLIYRIDIEDEVEMEDEGYGEGTELMGESKW